MLKNDEEMFRSGNFEDKNQLVDCDTEYPNRYWGYSNVTAGEIKCLIFHGTASGLEQNLYPEIYASVMFDHMEIALHDSYGSLEYWTARRSMRYNSALYDVANDFREKYLGSNDKDDDTELPDDWRDEKVFVDRKSTQNFHDNDNFLIHRVKGTPGEVLISAFILGGEIFSTEELDLYQR